MVRDFYQSNDTEDDDDDSDSQPPQNNKVSRVLFENIRTDSLSCALSSK